MKEEGKECRGRMDPMIVLLISIYLQDYNLRPFMYATDWGKLRGNEPLDAGWKRLF